MDTTRTQRGPLEAVLGLQRATNARDLEALVACFAPDYRNETPVHSERGFVGGEQVRANWEQIFGAIPDLSCEILRSSVDGETVWSEWEHRGTRPDGTPHEMRGVIIFGVAEGFIAWGRFYLEPVQRGAGTVDEAIRRQVASGGQS